MESQATAMLPMNGGDGLHSYTHNSSFQKEGLKLVEFLLREAVFTNLDVEQLLSSSNSFNIADLGCSTGSNAISAVQIIIDSILLKQKVESSTPEFQVFFNDLTENDFNTLFESLPLNRKYFASAVPGSFHGRLFPKASLHFVHSSYALHWLSSIPKEVFDKKSPAYNRGRIYHSTAPSMVTEAYSAQFGRDVKLFFDARAQEIVCGGLMAFLILCSPDGVKTSEISHSIVVAALETSLIQLVKMGLINADKVDSFNLPGYHPKQEEVKASILENGCFTIERMEQLVRSSKKPIDFIPWVVATSRAIWEGMIKEHFGNEIIEELFDLFSKKVEQTLKETSGNRELFDLYVLVKRNK
ncbi:hypothetical protein ACFE04_005583 [Oxalis oulophora]